MRELGQRGCANRRPSLQLFSESACVLMQDKARVQHRDDATFAQKSCEKIAEVPEIRHAPRTKIACTRPCAAHYYFTTSLRVERVRIASRSEKARVQHRDHAIFVPNSRERIAKFPKKIGAPRAQKLHEISQRDCTNLGTSFNFVSEPKCVLMQDNSRVQRRDHANFAQQLRGKFAKLPEIRRASRTKICAHSASVR